MNCKGALSKHLISEGVLVAAVTTVILSLLLGPALWGSLWGAAVGWRVGHLTGGEGFRGERVED